ncbi:MAG: tRNA lysidine(34) synthetase TilS [Leptolyngbyaceae cyanobacterium RU_5_1]|nr:tRNA lysidine(34) synthetase TilS [Leptolyngbyaceae cyanobacterium RU_5_1]
MADHFLWTLLHAHLHQTLRDRKLLESGQPVLVAVSGGQDSLCLARLLLDLQPKWKWTLAIAHCDHRWRDDSEANAAFVHDLAQSWQLPFYLQTAEQRLTSEATARQWRYQSLCAIAQKHGYNHIATGHTASDRAETLLYNLVRGSGADGLQALTWKRPLTPEINLVRPLLTLNRAQTAQFCHDLQLHIWQDSTNQDLNYARNRIRLELLPYLQTHLNPQVEQALAQTVELLQAEVDYLETEAGKLLQQAVQTLNIGAIANSSLPPEKFSVNQTHSEQSPLPAPQISLNRRILQTVPLALQRRVMRQILLKILPCAPNFEQVEKLVALINAPNRSQTDPFPGGAIAHAKDDQIWLGTDEQEKKMKR